MRYTVFSFLLLRQFLPTISFLLSYRPVTCIPVAFVPAPSPPVTNFLSANTVVPCAAAVSTPVIPVAVSPTDYSVVSCVNFVPVSAFTSSSCINTTQ